MSVDNEFLLSDRIAKIRAINKQYTRKKIVNGKNTDLHIDKSVYAIHFTNVREVF